MRELTRSEIELAAGGEDTHADIGYFVGWVTGTVVDGIRDGYNAAVNATTDALCWATGDC